VDEVLNHAYGRPKSFWRDILPRHRTGDLRRRAGEGLRRRMGRIRFDGSNPATLRTLFRHGYGCWTAFQLHPRAPGSDAPISAADSLRDRGATVTLLRSEADGCQRATP